MEKQQTPQELQVDYRDEAAEITEKDRGFRFLVAQIAICVLAVCAALLLRAFGSDVYSYAKEQYRNNFNKPINIRQVLSEDEARLVVAAQATAYGIGGEADDDENVVQSYNDITSDESKIIDASDINSMSKPVKGKVTCEYGWRIHPISGKWSFHTGIDIGAEHSSGIYSVMDGTVKQVVKNNDDYGNYIIINHSDGVDTMYAHCSSITAKDGAAVKKGDAIAKVGSTGLSTGPHLHFEIRVNGRRLNPRWFLEL